MTLLITALKAIAELPGLIRLIADGLAELKAAQRAQWIAEGQELERKIIVAKTDKERAAYVKSLSDLLGRMP